MGHDQDVATLLADSAERFLAHHHSPARARAQRVQSGEGDRAFWALMSEQGWVGLRIAEAAGGAGLPLAAAIGLVRVFGAHAVPDGLVEGALLPGALLVHLPETAEITALGMALASGYTRFAVAWQSRLGQVVPEPTIVAQRDGATVRLDGTAVFVPRAADQLLVLATLDDMPALIHVEESQGMTWHGMRLSDGVQTGEIQFTDAPGRLLHAGPAALTALTMALREATIATAAVLEALAARALDITLEFARQRVQFGQPLVEFQALQHRLVDLRMQIMLSAASWRRALALYEQAPLSNEAASAVSAAKARASDTALLVTRSAIQLHGAMGYTEEAEIGLYLRAAVRHAACFGNASAHRAQHYALASAERAA